MVRLKEKNTDSSFIRKAISILENYIIFAKNLSNETSNPKL